MSDRLDRRLQRIARTPVLLVATDFDGTITPIVDDPSHARPHDEAMVVLYALATLPETHVAVLTGRALGNIRSLVSFPPEIHLVGSHGGEHSGRDGELAPEQIALIRRIRDEAGAIAQRAPGCFVEHKPIGIAFHYRNAHPAAAEEVVSAVLAGPAAVPGVRVRHGKMVIELSVVDADKGTALGVLRARLAPTAVIFLGDDTTDEDAFTVLRENDVGVKVGDGDTAAPFRVGDTRDVVSVLARLFELRRAWLDGVDAVPIERHTMLSDHRTFAMVAPDARIAWLCLPRLDSAGFFSELIGGPRAGFFAIAPAAPSGPPQQRYLDDSLVVETRWPEVAVVDFLDCSDGRPSAPAGPSNLLRVVSGSGRAVVEFAPRLDFGRAPTRLEVRDGMLVVLGAHEPVVLRAPGVAWDVIDDGMHQRATAEIELAGRSITFELAVGEDPDAAREIDPDRRLRSTIDWWQRWADALVLPAVEPAAVRRSALLIRGLVFEPTGAIAAAATTSLPESIGGVRNWDYRFCWIRDAALSASSLLDLGCAREARRFLEWLRGVLDECGSAERLRPLYTVTGVAGPPEAAVAELSGYRGSRPVRIGNAASEQFQLDVYGPIVQLADQLAAVDADAAAPFQTVVDLAVRAVATRWCEPDHGIWEIRGAPRHYVYSKVMCWLALDRAIGFYRRLGLPEQDGWPELREQIAEDVLRHGLDRGRNLFTAAYESVELDAASLHVGLSGMVPPDDPRFAATVEAVRASLLHGPVVYRYHSDDMLPGLEGGFNLCTAWLIRSLAMLDRMDEARALFRDMLALAGPTGLIPEEYDPVARIGLGNVPQAYSHIGVIDGALALSRAALDRLEPAGSMHG